MGKKWKQWQTIFLGSKITVDGDCSHQIRRRLLLGRKAVTTDSVLKSRDITLLKKICVVKTMVLPVVMYGCESLTIKKAECQRSDTFELWCWRRLLKVPWTARRSNQSILRKINPEYSLEGLMLKLKLQYLSHQMQTADSLKKSPMLKRSRAEGEEGIRGWDSSMASLIQWTWTWANSRRGKSSNRNQSIQTKGSPGGSVVKPAKQEVQVWSLGQEDPLEKEMASHSSILAWKIPWSEEPGGLQSMASQGAGHD